MDYKKLWIEGAVYPAMALLQKNQVAARTRQLLNGEAVPWEDRKLALRQRLSELLYLCKTQVAAYSDMPYTDLDIRREPLDCLQAVDPILLRDFFEEADHHLSRLANPEKLLACRFLQAEQERTLYLTQPQLEQYEAARWRGLSWFGVTFGSPSVRLWDRPRPSFLLQEEPYLKNRLSSFCVRHDGTQRGSHGGGDRPLPTGVPFRQRLRADEFGEPYASNGHSYENTAQGGDDYLGRGQRRAAPGDGGGLRLPGVPKSGRAGRREWWPTCVPKAASM